MVTDTDLTTTTAAEPLTGDDLLDLPPSEIGQRYELIEGELVIMPPMNTEHGFVELNVAMLIASFVRQHGLGRTGTGEVGFYTRGDERTVRAADVVFFSFERLPADAPLTGFRAIPPDLVVEVVSPGDRAADIEQKTQEWLTFGARLVWIVYPESRRVHVFMPGADPRILSEQDALTGGEVLPDFSTPVSALFTDL